MLRFVMVAVVAACSSKKPSEPVCKVDDDCVMSCGRQDQCCPAAPCDTVMLRSAAAAFAAKEAKRECKPQEVFSCPRGPQVKQARCQAGACIAVASEAASNAALSTEPAAPVARPRSTVD